MSDYSSLKATINANVKANNNHEITGTILNSVLTACVNSLGAKYQYAGVATPETDPGTPDQNLFYIATKPGTYTNFSGISVLPGEIVAIKGTGSTWTKEVVDLPQKFLFAENCPFIKEMYINEAGVAEDIGKVNNAFPTYLRFANSAGTAFVARTLYNPSVGIDNSGVIPIVKESDNDIILGYVVVDWSYLDSEWPYYGNAINDIAKNVNYSPAIKAFLDEGEIMDTIFPVGTFPWIKELYINELGVAEDVSILNNINIPTNGLIRFANSAGSAFTARITFTENVGIFPVVKDDDATIVLGYALIDGVVGIQQQESSPAMRLNEKQYSLDYSPSIKAMINQDNTEQLNLLIETVEGKIYERDNADKDMSNINSVTTTIDYIWVEYPQTNKIKKVNRVRYRAYRGTTNFYIVTINGNNATWDLIGSAINDVSEEYSIKVFDFETITLNDNQYIGVNGSVFFSATSQGYKSFNIDISTGVVNNPGDMCFAFIPENTNSIDGQIDEINNGINTTSIGHSVGLTINQYDTIITLANDNTGDYNDFHSAANAAINAVYGGNKVLLLIKDGIYNINAEQKGGRGYPVLFDIKGVGEVVLQCLYNGADPNLVESYAPLDIAYTTNHNTIRIENITVIVDNVRYCVHDEMGSLNMPSYTHIFKNCKFIHKTLPNEAWHMPRCIGGGLGNKGLVIIDNCEFESKIDTSVDYHSGYNGNAQSSKVIIKSCILANNTISASSTAYESEQSIMIIESCILNAEPVYNDPENCKDIKLICKNNIIV